MITDEHLLEQTLPGSWFVVATNFPMWLTGRRLSPTFDYAPLGTAPLRLADTVGYLTRAGKPKRIVGTDVLRAGTFIWRGRGVLRLFASRWTVTALAADGSFAVIRFSRTIATPAGTDIIVRDLAALERVRELVSADPEAYGIPISEFEGLTWLQAAGE